MPPARTDPFPVILRIVSGRKTTMSANTSPERIRRKTKMDLKPKKLDRIPPRTGPMAMLKFRTSWISVSRLKSDKTLVESLTSLIEADESSTLRGR